MLSISAKIALATALAGLVSGCNDQPKIMPQIPSDFPVMAFDQNFVMARGTWRIEGEKSAEPFNVTEIGCWKDIMECRFASADATEFAGQTYLDVHQETHRLSVWDNERIVIQTTGRCRKIVTTITRADRSVTQVQTLDLNADGCEPDGNGNDKLGLALLRHPRVIRMMAGDEARRHLTGL